MKKNALNASRPIAGIFSFNNPELHIININWYNPTSENTNFQITIDLIYQGNMKLPTQGFESINEYVVYLKSIFKNYDIIYDRDQKNITNIAGATTIPARIVIQKQNENNYYAR